MDERKTIPQRMDDLVMWTGIPRFAQRRRPLRWLSATSATAAVAGFLVSAVTGFAARATWIGYAILMVGFMLGTCLQIFGPLKPFNSPERVDEFDRTLRSRAYLFAFPVFALATVAGLLLLMFMMVMRWPSASVILCLAELMLMLAALSFAVPTAYASWSVEWHKDEV